MLIAVLVIYLIVGVTLFVALETERVKQETDFNYFQIVVAIGWPIWLALYAYSAAAAKLAKRNK